MDYRERFELKEYLGVRRFDRRVRFLHVVLIAVLAVFGLNFWYLQVVKGDEFERLAENNRHRKIPLPPYRGLVTDRHGRVIASSRPSLDLVLDRENLRDLDAQLERLAPILRKDVSELYERYRELRGRPLFEPVVLMEDVGLRELARIESRRELFPSVDVRQAARRSYPAGAVVAHALGYIGEVSTSRLEAGAEAEALRRGDIVGKAGLERVYDERLRGRRGFRYVSVNSLGRQSGVPRAGEEPVHGRPVRVTLDLDLQRVLMEGFGEEAGAGVFLDPNSGEVLAMVSTPAYDPNLFVGGISHADWEAIQEDVRRPLHNRAISSFYAPGSTFKVLMALAGLDVGAVDEGTRAYCNGSARVYGARRLCWKRGGHGWVDLRKAITHSCNIYFYELAQKIEIDTVHRYGAMFGLGAPSGIDLTGEAGGILPSDAWKRRQYGEPWYPGDTVSVAIGQGLLAVTPLQMARLVGAIATGGTVPTPHVRSAPSDVRESLPLRPSHLDLVRASMVDVVVEGTGKRAAIDAAQVAGKTGTAQVFKHSAGIDSEDLPKNERDHAWFVGYAPADDPQIAFAVIVEHGGHGGVTAAPIAREVLREFFESRAERADPGSVASGGEGAVDDVVTTAAR